MRLTCAARTHPGLRRGTNEDAVRVRDDLGFCIVADGMGGHVAGEVAAGLVVEEVERFVAASAIPGGGGERPVADDPALGPDGNRLRAGLHLANRRLAELVAEDPTLEGMATTAVALLVYGADAALAHVGDSRAYRRRAGQLARLTRDHSWVEDQVHAGFLTADEARRHHWRHVVTRALTGEDGLEVEVATWPIEAGDRLLLCTDGLPVVLSDDRINELLGGGLPPDGVAARLIDAANAAGGPDNITVVVVEVDAR